MPHFLLISMRKILSILFLSLLLCSCFKNSGSDYTARIYISDFVLQDSLRTDTFSLHWNAEGFRQVDTLTVGDTLLFAVEFDAIGDNLLSAKLSWDTSSLALYTLAYSSVSEVLLETSDSAACKFDLPTGYNIMALPFYCSPKREGAVSVGFHVETDSKFSPVEDKIYIVSKK